MAKNSINNNVSSALSTTTSSEAKRVNNVRCVMDDVRGKAFFPKKFGTLKKIDYLCQQNIEGTVITGGQSPCELTKLK